MTFRAMSSTKKCQYQKSDLSKNSLNVKICPITLEVCIPVSHLIMYEMGYIISLYLFSVKYRIDLENIVIGQQRKAISFRSCITSKTCYIIGCTKPITYVSKDWNAIYISQGSYLWPKQREWVIDTSLGEQGFSNFWHIYNWFGIP